MNITTFETWRCKRSESLFDSARGPQPDELGCRRPGIAHVPQRPGIGVDLDWAAIENTCVEHKVTNH
ncbi:MAG: hypothetical protein M3O30_10425 [Planctomycetota bacterium]|nr:hypothetical protein [Planctomycetota bacterium]